WDQQTMMRPRGAAGRAEELATLGRVIHERFTAPAIGRLLDELADFEQEHPRDSFEASLLRVTRVDWEKARKVPVERRAEMSRASSLAHEVWVRARAENDFASFLPALRENLELRRRYIACFEGDYDEPYDAALDDYERGMKTTEVRTIFEYLKEHQAPLVHAVADAEPLPEAGPGTFPIELQKQFELEVVRRFGFDDASWRLDPTVHPFASGAGTQDIRITTRYFESNLDGLFATMHECGHGLYEHQIDTQLERSPLARGTSYGMHESQSRMWENVSADLPELPEAFEQGEFGPLREWLRDNLHRHGRKFTPSEMLERAAGVARIDPEPYVRYLRDKIGDIYGMRLDVAAPS